MVRLSASCEDSVSVSGSRFKDDLLTVEVENCGEKGVDVARDARVETRRKAGIQEDDVLLLKLWREKRVLVEVVEKNKRDAGK